MKKKLRNYTSAIPATTSMAMIEKELVAIGAGSVNRVYIKGQCTCFEFNVAQHAYRLPVNTDKIVAKHKLPPEQAERTAWKTLYEWVQIQCDMIRLNQTETDQVFLPYMLAQQGQTVYEIMKATQNQLNP